MREERRYAFLCLLLLFGNLLLAGCNSTQQHVAQAPTRTPEATVSDPDDQLVDKPIPTTGCGKASPVKPGSSANQLITVDPAVSNGIHERSYLVHVPPGYDREQPVAVVLAFHGHGGDAAGEESGTGFSTLADRDGFLAVYPQGLLDDEGLPFWASDGPIDYGIDDALFVSNVLTKLQEDFCIDPSRIYATGFSNGGGMSGFLACKLAGRIAAFVPVSGNYYALPDGCNPARAAPILEIHGTADSIVPYEGIPAIQSPLWPLPSIPQWLQDWATRDGCTQGPLVFLQTANVTGEHWIHCKGNATVVHYRMEGEGHSLPATIGGIATDVLMWNFFQAHSLSD
jgi:polyhydroxybutyrate depolymerase